MGKVFQQKTLEFHINLVMELLVKCTPEQEKVFWKAFPDGVTAKNAETAHDLVQRTIDKNEGRHG